MANNTLYFRSRDCNLSGIIGSSANCSSTFIYSARTTSYFTNPIADYDTNNSERLLWWLR